MAIRENQIRPTFIRAKTVAILCLLPSLFMTNQSPAQENDSYPRTAVFHFGKTAPADWYARFNLVDIRTADPEVAKAIKALNPKTLVFGTRDWNNGSLFKPTDPAYRTYHSDGTPVFIYGSRTNNFTVNFSDFCGKINGLRYNEALPRAVLNSHNQSAFDGIATDGLWMKPRQAEKDQDIDLDRDGKNDYNQHGRDWVNEKWKAGVDKVLTEINRLNNNRPLILNSGRFHLESEGFDWSNHNGLILENTRRMNDISYFKRIYENWVSQARKPHLLLFDGLGNHKEDYVHMRYLLGLALFGDGYFCFSDNSLHHYHYYYDEFDVDLGQPTTGMTLLRETGPKGEGVYARFFTKGAVIVNAGGSSQRVSDADLKRVAGYAGPYFSFQGNQDPTTNSGSDFSEIQLKGERDGRNRVLGDAILLTSRKMIVVADIIIDNDERGTTPGSQPAAFKGSWVPENDRANQAWAMSYRARKGDYAMTHIFPGSGEATATFTPTIGVPGKYRVYEWHGDLEGASEASNTSYEIHHAGGTSHGRIDQRGRKGLWNFLGEYRFNRGTSGYARISNDADDTVIADAFKFVYTEGTEQADTTPPSPPTGVRVSK